MIVRNSSGLREPGAGPRAVRAAAAPATRLKLRPAEASGGAATGRIPKARGARSRLGGLRFGFGACAALLLSGTAAFANITAEQVWQSMIDHYGQLGYDISTGGESREGATLVIRDALFTSTLPEVDGDPVGTVAIVLDEIRLEELGDGRVEVHLPAEIPVQASGEAVDDDLGIVVRQTNFSTIVSGTPAALTYDFAGDEIAIDFEGIGGGADAPDTLTVTVAGILGSYALRGTAGTSLVSDSTAESLTIRMAGNDGALEAAVTLADLVMASEFFLPEGADIERTGEALRAGLDIEGSIRYGSGRVTARLVEAGSEADVSGSFAVGALTFGLSDKGFSYSARSGPATMEFAGNQMPFPVTFRAESSQSTLRLPVIAATEAQPYELSVSLMGLAVSNELWNMIDPGLTLPRDPANFILALGGEAEVTGDLMSPEAVEGDVPVAPQTLVLSQLSLGLAGASLTGSGDLRFDNSGVVPQPTGVIDLRLSGGTTLLGRLEALGLVPGDQAMAARMMLGLFTVEQGPDHLSSHIEFRDDGGFYVNDQRLQ